MREKKIRKRILKSWILDDDAKFEQQRRKVDGSRKSKILNLKFKI